MNNRSVRVILFVTTILFLLGIGWAIFAVTAGKDKVTNNNNAPSSPVNNRPTSNQKQKSAVKDKAPQTPTKTRAKISRPKTTPRYYYIIEYYEEVEVSAGASASASASSGSAYAEAHAW
jgi:hypothetical protein